MAIQNKPWDAAEVLTDTETIFYFVEASLEEPTPEHVAGSLETAVRARGGIEAFAREAGMEPSSIQQAISKPGEFTYEVAARVLRALRPSRDARVA